MRLHFYFRQLSAAAISTFFLISGFLAVVPLAAADDGDFPKQLDARNPGSHTASEIAAELASPNTDLGSLTFELDYISYGGDLPDAGDQNATRLTFQPILPYSLDKGTNLFVRPAIPIVFKQDVPQETGGYDDPGFNLGDTGFDVAVGRTFSSGLILIGGAAGTLPTATDDDLGKNQVTLGPEAAIAVAKPWGVLGVLVSHQWDVAGSTRKGDTNLTGGQYFYTFNLKDGWQITSSPTFSYDHEASSGQRWTVPVGFGVQKTSIINGRPWKFGIEYWNYVEKPDAFAPDWQIRFKITPVVALPW